MDVGTDLARRALARPNALTLAPRVARSLARFENAKAFNQDLWSVWNVVSVVSPTKCDNFCINAGFNPTSNIPGFPGTCGNPGC